MFLVPEYDVVSIVFFLQIGCFDDDDDERVTTTPKKKEEEEKQQQKSQTTDTGIP